MLHELCHKPLIEKTRYKIPFGGFIWEVDEFKGENEGLIFAEIELEYEGQKLCSYPHGLAGKLPATADITMPIWLKTPFQTGENRQSCNYTMQPAP